MPVSQGCLLLSRWRREWWGLAGRRSARFVKPHGAYALDRDAGVSRPQMVMRGFAERPGALAQQALPLVSSCDVIRLYLSLPRPCRSWSSSYDRIKTCRGTLW
jgi:hypothetical protein